jgi:hypothetical protein
MKNFFFAINLPTTTSKDYNYKKIYLFDISTSISRRILFDRNKAYNYGNDAISAET